MQNFTANCFKNLNPLAIRNPKYKLLKQVWMHNSYLTFALFLAQQEQILSRNFMNNSTYIIFSLCKRELFYGYLENKMTVYIFEDKFSGS